MLTAFCHHQEAHLSLIFSHFSPSRTICISQASKLLKKKETPPSIPVSTEINHFAKQNNLHFCSSLLELKYGFPDLLHSRWDQQVMTVVQSFWMKFNIIKGIFCFFKIVSILKKKWKVFYRLLFLLMLQVYDGSQCWEHSTVLHSLVPPLKKTRGTDNSKMSKV